MQSFAGSGPFIECLGRIILWCAERGEALVLLGCEEDWRAQRAFFECHCGQKPTLANRRDGGVLTTPEEERTSRELLRSLGSLDTS
jgi:hypothetical protein